MSFNLFQGHSVQISTTGNKWKQDRREHTHTHARTHARTHTRTHARTHTHTQNFKLSTDYFISSSSSSISSFFFFFFFFSLLLLLLSSSSYSPPPPSPLPPPPSSSSNSLLLFLTVVASCRSQPVRATLHRQKHSRWWELWVCDRIFYHPVSWAATRRLRGIYFRFWRLDAVMHGWRESPQNHATLSPPPHPPPFSPLFLYFIFIM